ncbi:44340_t:CDS:1, partial [Gigaspora margarita]
ANSQTFATANLIIYNARDIKYRIITDVCHKHTMPIFFGSSLKKVSTKAFSQKSNTDQT